MELNKYIGNKIRQYRKQNKLTQDDLAEILGLAKGTVSNYETGYRTPHESRLFELAEVLGVSINDLFPPTIKKETEINEIYSQLEPPRQQRVYIFAEYQLEEQRYLEEQEDYVGQTAAGAPIEGQQPVPMIGAKTVKLLVNGDSMDPMFKDGDIIKYQPQPELENGEIGVFAINGGVTMKRFKINDSIRLESLNKKYEDIVIKETDDFSILGKVIL